MESYFRVRTGLPNFPFYTGFAETSGNKNAVKFRKRFNGFRIFLKIFRIDPRDFCSRTDFGR